MTKPRFFSRVVDSLNPLLGSSVDLFDLLSREVVMLRAPAGVEARSEHAQGFLLAANLLARLYPRMVIEAENGLAEQAAAVIRRINPAVALNGAQSPTVELTWSGVGTIERSVGISAAGWNVIFGQTGRSAGVPPSNPFTTLAAAAFGAGELLRVICGPFLAEDRTGPSRGTFNLVRWDHTEDFNDPELPPSVDLGDVGLIGAGAIGQAFTYTLRVVNRVRGSLWVYDPEVVSRSNLQRYVLTGDEDEGTSKTTLVQRALAGSSLTVAPEAMRWEDASQLPPILCVGLDDAMSRIRVQSALPRTVYNAWTQPRDLGWSIHDAFGSTPCLACLYWPATPRPGYHELIAASIAQHPARVLGYLVHHVPISQPLRREHVPRVPDSPLPDQWVDWTDRSLLDDLVTRFPRLAGAVDGWAEKPIGDLYREGVCGGALLSHVETSVQTDVAVPLAHQSVLAGIMLALQVVTASVPELLALRSRAPEGRIDVLSPFPQVVSRPRVITPGCFCQDNDFHLRFHEKWRGQV